MTALEHNITDTLAALRAARSSGDLNRAKHQEARLNWLLDRLASEQAVPAR